MFVRIVVIIMTVKIEQYIRERVFGLGFGAVGFARVEPSRSVEVFQQWLDKGYCAEMHYLKRHAALRSDPRNLAPQATLVPQADPPARRTLAWQAKSIIVVAAKYPSEASNCPVSNYARGSDYHDVLRAKLEQLSAALDEKTGRSCGGRICVDSAPLPEREWAVRAGIGWIGRQGSVVNPELGCCFFIGELLVNIDLEPSAPMANQCQDCRLCVDACPTAAIMADNLIDARRCISYLTVEHKGEINPEIASCFGGSVFGCDRCTSVCPLNRPYKTPIMPEFDVSLATVLSLEVLGRLDRQGFKKMFAKTSVNRIGFERFQRNVKTVLENQKKGKM